MGLFIPPDSDGVGRFFCASKIHPPVQRMHWRVDCDSDRDIWMAAGQRRYLPEASRSIRRRICSRAAVCCIHASSCEGV